MRRTPARISAVRSAPLSAARRESAPRSDPPADPLPPDVSVSACPRVRSPGSFVSAVLSNNLHEVHGYNRLVAASRGDVRSRPPLPSHSHPPPSPPNPPPHANSHNRPPAARQPNTTQQIVIVLQDDQVPPEGSCGWLLHILMEFNAWPRLAAIGALCDSMRCGVHAVFHAMLMCCDVVR